MTNPKQISIYIGPPLEAALATGGGRNRSHRINQIADRYLEILRRTSLPEFSEAEWNLLRDALNGVLHEPAANVRGVWMGVQDAIELDGLDAKWDVDGAALIKKLRDLSYTHEVALAEAIEEWWAGQRE